MGVRRVFSIEQIYKSPATILWLIYCLLLIPAFGGGGGEQGSHHSQPQRTSYESGPAIFHCVTVMSHGRGGGGGGGGGGGSVGGRGEGVIFIAICDKGFPKRVAYGYLEELAREFDSLFHNQVVAESPRTIYMGGFGVEIPHSMILCNMLSRTENHSLPPFSLLCAFRRWPAHLDRTSL